MTYDRLKSTSFAIVLGSILSAGLFSSAHAQTIMNLGWATPMESNNGVFAQKFAERVADLTNGAIEVRLRPSAQVATEDDAVKALQLGTVDGYLVSVNNISPHFGLMDVFVLPYIFRDRDHALAVVDGDVGKFVREEFLAQAGVHLVSYNNIEVRDFYNTVRPINTIEDLAGLKVRVPRNEVMIATFRAFGAEPVPMAWSETPTALQTGTIDGGDNGTSVVLDMRFYEFADNLAILEHFTGFTPLLASDSFMSRLPDGQADLVRQAAIEAQAHQRDVMQAQLDEIRAELERNGMELTYPEREAFIAAAQTVQDEFATDKGEDFRSLVEKIRAVGM
ncbi:MAG: TRAP transporter substrate-binding protein [Salinarimonas sp.]